MAQVPATVGHTGASQHLDKAQGMNGVVAPGAPNDASNTSRKLTLDDFARVRTLGTGKQIAHHNYSQAGLIYSISCAKGTFARVCLVRLANPSNETERNKVFALKILRKTEGLRILSRRFKDLQGLIVGAQ